MKIRFFNILFISSISYIVFFICLLLFGILVDYERNTGPDLHILYGGNKLKSYSQQFKINGFEGAYTTYQFDSQYGFESIDLSFCFYEVIGSRDSDNKGEKVALLKIKRFYSIYIIFPLLIISVVLCWFGFKNLWQNMKKAKFTRNVKFFNSAP